MSTLVATKPLPGRLWNEDEGRPLEHMMDRVAVIIPVKGLAAAKSRLAGLLSPYQRRMLVLGCLRLELEALSRVTEIAEIVVVTPDLDVRRLAEAMGARVLVEPAAHGHNEAVRHAVATCGGLSSADILVLPADLPLVNSTNIRRLLLLRPRGGATIAIVPDRHGSGTNALVCSGGSALPFLFGPDSFRHHVDAARKHRLDVRTLEQTRLELDIDTPEDIAILHRVEPDLYDWLIGNAEDSGVQRSKYFIEEEGNGNDAPEW